jgi:hypothetical protein
METGVDHCGLRAASLSISFFQRFDFSYIGLDVRLALEPGGRHLAYRSENRPLVPGSVMQSIYAGDVGVAVGIARIQKVFVHQGQRHVERFPRRAAPLQDLFRPIHAHVVVHVSGVQHLPLGRVPILVVGVGSFELSLRAGDWLPDSRPSIRKGPASAVQAHSLAARHTPARDSTPPAETAASSTARIRRLELIAY